MLSIFRILTCVASSCLAAEVSVLVVLFLDSDVTVGGGGGSSVMDDEAVRFSVTGGGGGKTAARGGGVYPIMSDIRLGGEARSLVSA